MNEKTLEVNPHQTASVWSTGFAMFSMFFGAGNIVFPLMIGYTAQDKSLYAAFGMMITAVIIPLTGLVAMLLYEGNYEAFFQRIGKFPGFLITLLILGVIGPFGGIPRCITISYSTLHVFDIKGLNLVFFSLASCLVIFLFTFRKTKILNLLGYVLTPILLFSLITIVIKGIWSMPPAPLTDETSWHVFSQGIIGGYNTMDLLAAFFFSSIVVLCLKRQKVEKSATKRIVSLSCVLAASLLALFTLCFACLAAHYHQALESVSRSEMLGALANQVLGKNAGLFASITVAFACLTTEIALTAVFAEYLRKTLLKETLSYHVSLGITLLVAFFISILQFEGITSFLAPLLKICYPALIVLTGLNILYKAYAFRPVKLIFYATVMLSLITYFLA